MGNVSFGGTPANRERVADALAALADRTGHFADLLADDVRWTIEGNSVAGGTYESKQAFVDAVLAPFGRRLRERFRPVAVRRLYADGDGVAPDGVPYRNAYPWFLSFRDGLVAEATAFFDAPAFDLWGWVAPSEG